MPPRASPIVRIARLGDIFPHRAFDVEVLQRQHDPAVGQLHRIHDRRGEVLPVVDSRRTLPRGPVVTGHDVIHVRALLVELGALAVFGPLQEAHPEQVNGAVAADEVYAALPTAQPHRQLHDRLPALPLDWSPPSVFDGQMFGNPRVIEGAGRYRGMQHLAPGGCGHAAAVRQDADLSRRCVTFGNDHEDAPGFVRQPDQRLRLSQVSAFTESQAFPCTRRARGRYHRQSVATGLAAWLVSSSATAHAPDLTSSARWDSLTQQLGRVSKSYS